MELNALSEVLRKNAQEWSEPLLQECNDLLHCTLSCLDLVAHYYNYFNFPPPSFQ